MITNERNHLFETLSFDIITTEKQTMIIPIFSESLPAWAWAIIIVVLVTVVIPGIPMLTIVPNAVTKIILARTKPSKFSRDEPSDRKNEDMLYMWGEALKFREENKDKEEDVRVVTEDGLHLAGLYYDFKGDTAVIILPGRPETCIYSLYYGISYARAGVNVMVIDSRAHGESEGYWTGCGYAEQLDILAFAKYLHEEKGINKIVLHGICVGSSAVAHCAARKDLPPYIVGVVTDGLYATYYESLKIRIRKNGGMVYPGVWAFRSAIKKLYQYDVKKDGPINAVKNIRVPMMMIASKEDIYSLPRNTQLLFDNLASSDKQLQWWEHGMHSHLRSFDTERYDKVIADFVAKFQK